MMNEVIIWTPSTDIAPPLITFHTMRDTEEDYAKFFQRYGKEGEAQYAGYLLYFASTGLKRALRSADYKMEFIKLMS